MEKRLPIPAFSKKEHKNLAQAQKKGPLHVEKQGKVIAKIHKRIRNRRITDWIIVHDRTNLKTYFRTYESLHIQMVDLNKVDFSQEGFQRALLAKDFIVEDVTKNLEAFSK